MSGLIWIQTVLHFDGISERIFRKVGFEKNQQTTKSKKNYLTCKELLKKDSTNLLSAKIMFTA